MIDALAEVIDLLTPWTGCSVYRGQLPKAYANTCPAVVVTLSGDDHHQTSATRRLALTFRVYGGSASATICAAWYNALLDRVSNSAGGNILRIGELNGQELPPDPVTGWPAYLLRAVALLKES